MKFVLAFLVVSVALSFAGEPMLFGGTSSGSTFSGTDAETILWTQPPTGYAQASQKFTDQPTTYDSGVADDFEFGTATTINRIRVWGGYWNGGVTADTDMEIYLYLDDGTGVSPTLPEHTSAIASWMLAPGSYTEVADGANYRIEYTFPSWVVFDPNVQYWFEVRKAMSFTTNGQYGWIQSASIDADCVQGFTGLGTAWWTPQSGYGAAFELIYDDAVALERTTWGDIKSTF